MEINPDSSDCQELRLWIDTQIETLVKGLKAGHPKDADKDMVLTWWNRGQIVALEKIKGLITVKEEENG